MKNLVVCLDGTWDGTHSDSHLLTNVMFIADSCVSQEGHPILQTQVVYYGDGVGVGSLMIDKYVMGAFGYGVFTQARRAWKFLRLNYQPGDKIYIFGFSRGAYAARQLASMIVHCGVDNSTWSNIERDFRGWLKVAGTPIQFPRAEVHFLGLFDCVPANHFIGKQMDRHRLNSPVLENGIRNIRHALANSERRWSFEPLVFVDNGSHDSFDQLIFPGYHRDVGGGGPSSEGLATIPMWWIMRAAYGLDLEFRMISCRRHHREETFMGNVNRHAEAQSSDNFATDWLHIRHVRSNRSAFKALKIAPVVDNMAMCTRSDCGFDMF
jgi:uncharacterized protein (DUF2235 family)